jgi:hypothetical protein
MEAAKKQSQFKANLLGRWNLPKPSPSLRDEAATWHRPAKKKGDLKKQSQFVPGRMGAKSFVKGDYGNMPARGDQKNKANQSQMPAFGRKL